MHLGAAERQICCQTTLCSNYLQRHNDEGTNTSSSSENATADFLESWIGKSRGKVRNKGDNSGMVQQLDLHPQAKKRL